MVKKKILIKKTKEKKQTKLVKTLHFLVFLDDR